MGSVSIVENENALYDTVYKLAAACLQQNGINTIRYADHRENGSDIPESYAFLRQLHLGYEKDTLKPNMMRRSANLLCELNMLDIEYSKGKAASDALQRLFLRSSSEYGMSVDRIDSLITNTALGHTFVVSVSFNFNTVI